jgi:hypothetical protein
MVFLDSNTIIYLSKGLISVDDVFKSNEQYCVSIITHMEVLGYDFESNEEKKFIEELLSYLHIIYIDEAIAKKVIKIRRKNKIKLPDAIICATALINKATLMTNDTRLEKIENLQINFLQI